VTRRERDRPSVRSPSAPPRRMSFLAGNVLLLALLSVGTSAGPASAAAAEPDVTYLRSAHQANLAVIAAGQDAQRNGRTSCVRELGALLVRDHRRLDAQARPVARQLGVTLPSEPASAHQQELAAVRAEAGTPGYDAAWLAAQERQHRQALTLIDQERIRGSAAAVRAVANAARPVVQMHQDMIRGGRCRPPATSMTVATGDGGQVAGAWQLRRLTGLGLVGAGGLLIAGWALALLRRRFTPRSGSG
jgi:putative membrane protein